MATNTSKIGINTISVKCSDSQAQQSEWLIKLLGQLHSQGVPIDDGKVIEFGWSMLILKRQPNGILSVEEPNFSGDPWKETRDDISCTLAVQHAQNIFSEKIQAQIQPASFQDKIIISRGCLETSRVFLERNPDSPAGDSGWYIGPYETEQNPEELEALYIYELLKRRPSLMPVLGLPSGFLVVFRGDEIEAVLNEKNENLLKNFKTLN